MKGTPAYFPQLYLPLPGKPVRTVDYDRYRTGLFIVCVLSTHLPANLNKSIPVRRRRDGGGSADIHVFILR